MKRRQIFIIALLVIAGMVSSQDQQDQEQLQGSSVQDALIGIKLNLFGFNDLVHDVLIGNNSNNESTHFLIPNLTLDNTVFLFNNTCQIYNGSELASNISLDNQNLSISLQNMYLNCSGQFNLLSSDNNQTNNTNEEDTTESTDESTQDQEQQDQSNDTINGNTTLDGESSDSGTQSENQTNGTSQGLWYMNLIGLNVTINTTLFYNQTQNNTILPQFRLMNTSIYIQNYSVVLVDNTQNTSSDQSENQTSQYNQTIPYSNSTLLLLGTSINEQLNATVLRELERLNAYIMGNLSELSINENIKFYPSVNETQIVSTEQQNLLFFVSGFIYDIRQPIDGQFQYDLETIDLSDPVIETDEEQQDNDEEENDVQNETTTTTVTVEEEQTSTDENSTSSSSSSGTSSVTTNLDEGFSENPGHEVSNNKTDMEVIVGVNILRDVLLRYILGVNNFNESYLNEKVNSSTIDLKSFNITLNDYYELQILKHTDQILHLILNNYILRVQGNTTDGDDVYEFDFECEVRDFNEKTDTFVTLYNANKTNNESNLTIQYPQISVGEIFLNIDDDNCEIEFKEVGDRDGIWSELQEAFIENFSIEDYLEEVQEKLNQNAPQQISDNVNQNINDQWNPIDLDRLESQIWLSLRELVYVNDQNQLWMGIDFLVSRFVPQQENGDEENQQQEQEGQNEEQNNGQ